MTAAFKYEKNHGYKVSSIAQYLSYAELPAAKLGIAITWKSKNDHGITLCNERRINLISQVVVKLTVLL